MPQDYISKRYEDFLMYIIYFLDLFDKQVTISEVMAMDIPFFTNIVKVREKYLKEKHEREKEIMKRNASLQAANKKG